MYELKKCRESKGFSQKQVALSIGVTPPQVSKWEAGVTEPTLEKFIRLADLLDVTLDALAGRQSVIGVRTPQERDLLAAFRALDVTAQARAIGFVEGLANSAAQKSEEVM